MFKRSVLCLLPGGLEPCTTESMHKYLQMRVDNHLESWIPQQSAHTNLAQNCDPWRRGADEVTCLITRMFEQFWTASLSAAAALY
jgi:hypothetical protein